MKKFLSFLFVFFLLGFAVSKGKFLEKLPKKEVVHFTPSIHPLKNLPFVVIVVGRNNGAFLEKMLNSILTQKYETFRIVYVDDGSDDGSLSFAKDFIQDKKIELIHHETSMGIGESVAEVLQTCQDEEVVVVVHTAGFFAHEWVLERLNQYFVNPDLWLFEAASSSYPTYTKSEETLKAGLASALKQEEFDSVFTRDFGHHEKTSDILYVVRKAL